MAAAASAVILPALAKGAKSAAGTISEALTADLAVIRWQGKKLRNRRPIEYEVHVNPAAIGVGVVGVGLAMWLLQMRMSPTKDEKGKTRFVVKERQGFLGNGVGTSIESSAVSGLVFGPVVPILAGLFK